MNASSGIALSRCGDVLTVSPGWDHVSRRKAADDCRKHRRFARQSGRWRLLQEAEKLAIKSPPLLSWSSRTCPWWLANWSPNAWHYTVRSASPAAEYCTLKNFWQTGEHRSSHSPAPTSGRSRTNPCSQSAGKVSPDHCPYCSYHPWIGCSGLVRSTGILEFLVGELPDLARAATRRVLAHWRQRSHWGHKSSPAGPKVTGRAR